MTQACCEVDGCGRPVTDHAFVCVSCAAALREALVRLRDDLADDLDVSLARQARIGSGGGGRPAETPLPYGEAASETRWLLHTTLVSWVLVLLNDLRPFGPVCARCEHRSCSTITDRATPDETLPAMADWLATRVGTLRHHPHGPRAVDELLHAVRQADQAIDRPADRNFLGVCSVELDDGGECDAELYAPPGYRTFVCYVCKTSHDVAYRQKVLLEYAKDVLGTATELARALSGLGEHVTPSMIRGYAHRKRLVPRGTDSVGHPLYRLGDVLALIFEDAA